MLKLTSYWDVGELVDLGNLDPGVRILHRTGTQWIYGNNSTRAARYHKARIPETPKFPPLHWHGVMWGDQILPAPWVVVQANSCTRTLFDHRLLSRPSTVMQIFVSDGDGRVLTSRSRRTYRMLLGDGENGG